METRIHPDFASVPGAAEAEAILRRCVHCGFCNATCPTYQVRGDELDGPRGRIYLMKQALEGEAVSELTRGHLDRCLQCRACETTCPSGVEYARLLEFARPQVEARVPRSHPVRALHALLRAILPHERRLAPLIALGRLVRPLLPATLRRRIPAANAPGLWPAPRHARRMLVLRGCVQGAASPQINHAAARVLDRLGISLLEIAEAGCCGAMEHHLHAESAALERARRNIDAWWPQVEAGIEAIVITASGCGTMVRDYGRLLADDPLYSQKAARVAALARDLSEVIPADAVAVEAAHPRQPRVAFQSPCSLQHAQRLGGRVEAILRAAGFELVPVADAHLCCGSAGTYSLLQPALSGTLRTRKLEALGAGEPDVIASANIGCLLHLQGGTERRVLHWIELLDGAPAEHR